MTLSLQKVIVATTLLLSHKYGGNLSVYLQAFNQSRNTTRKKKRIFPPHRWNSNLLFFAIKSKKYEKVDGGCSRLIREYPLSPLLPLSVVGERVYA